MTDDGGVAFADAATLFTSPATVFTSADVELSTSSAVDVTGGIAGKMREAASVARLGVDVYVSSRLPDGAAAAIRHDLGHGRLEVRHALRLLLDHPVLRLQLLLLGQAVVVQVGDLLSSRREVLSKL